MFTFTRPILYLKWLYSDPAPAMWFHELGAREFGVVQWHCWILSHFWTTTCKIVASFHLRWPVLYAAILRVPEIIIFVQFITGFLPASPDSGMQWLVFYKKPLWTPSSPRFSLSVCSIKAGILVVRLSGIKSNRDLPWFSSVISFVWASLIYRPSLQKH